MLRKIDGFILLFFKFNCNEAMDKQIQIPVTETVSYYTNFSFLSQMRNLMSSFFSSSSTVPVSFEVTNLNLCSRFRDKRISLLGSFSVPHGSLHIYYRATCFRFQDGTSLSYQVDVIDLNNPHNKECFTGQLYSYWKTNERIITSISFQQIDK
jgi:hypothetical protein